MNNQLSLNYFDDMEKRLSRNFDIKKKIMFNNEFIDMYAYMQISNEKYFAMKNVKVWRAESYEHVYIKELNEISVEEIYKFYNFLINSIDKLVQPHKEHMETIITGVIVTNNNVDSEIENLIKKFRYRKNFHFSLYGWVEIRLLLVLSHENRVIANKRGREVSKYYLPILEKRELPKKGLTRVIKKLFKGGL